MRYKSVLSSNQESEPDLTPMLDIVFILLIFFVVTASFVKEYTVDIKNDSSGSPEPDQDNVTIFLADNGRIFLNGSMVPYDGLESRLLRLRAENPKMHTIVQPSPKVRTEVLMAVFDKTKSLGIDVSVGFADKT